MSNFNTKKVFFVIAATFLAFQYFKILKVVFVLYNHTWWSALIFGVTFNLFITGIFAFLGFALPTQKLLPNSYYEVKKPKQLTSIFKLFKVELFRKFLLVTFWKKKEQSAKHFNGRADGIENLVLQSKKSEFGHLIPFILLTMLCVYFAMKDMLKLALVTFIINWIFNWYPIILQRHHRMRASRILKRKNNCKH